MPINQQEVQKEFLQRINIRTMRKDLQKLREADVTQASRKITATPAFSEAKPFNIPIKPFDPAQGKPAATSPSIPRAMPTPQEQEAIAQAKKLATEEEKQRIFLLESQKAQVQEKMKATESANNPALILEKNSILLELKQLQEKLSPLALEEQKLEARLKEVEERENQTAVPAQQKALEQDRMSLEDRREETEKKRWTLEEKMGSLQKRLKALSENYEKASGVESALREEIAHADHELRTVYTGTIEREKQRRVAKQAPAPAKPTPQKPVALPKKQFMKEVSPAIKQKMAAATPAEEEQRRKFMEDVDRWASTQSTSNK